MRAPQRGAQTLAGFGSKLCEAAVAGVALRTLPPTGPATDSGFGVPALANLTNPPLLSPAAVRGENVTLQTLAQSETQPVTE